VSPPKDPEKLAAYRQKMRRIALERGYGKWMAGKKHSAESIEKMRRAQTEIGNDPEERQRRSERAKELGVGKWMAGRPQHPATRTAFDAIRALPYDERYGERAEEERKKRQQGNTTYWANHERTPMSEEGRASHRAAGSQPYVERYGERADEERRKRSDAHRARWDGVPRRPQRAKHNGDYRYKEWRCAVFARDDYTCRRCGGRGGHLHAHHILSWARHPDDRYDVDNGVTLHGECHREVHRAMHGGEKISFLDIA
jgi:5-methylcytosine-specific restriction endonuclease McrA